MQQAHAKIDGDFIGKKSIAAQIGRECHAAQRQQERILPAGVKCFRSMQKRDNDFSRENTAA